MGKKGYCPNNGEPNGKEQGKLDGSLAYVRFVRISTTTMIPDFLHKGGIRYFKQTSN